MKWVGSVQIWMAISRDFRAPEVGTNPSLRRLKVRRKQTKMVFEEVLTYHDCWMAWLVVLISL